jgi:tetratricopeptide (TPR) repeat protein
VLGFANLVEFRTALAKEAFERAIALAPADPLPRLGLGLAQIRDGDLEQGRENLEVAVGLNANDALLRSYLGKAYFEEKREPLDAEQFAIAKELDPNDPTPWLYDGIRLQTENQPVAALHNLQRSIEINDNRAVYRSRLELDSDRASRGTSVARVYQDLGFNQLGVDLSTASIAQDPSNPAAHRFLSDSYVPIRRREISRVSELLQAQLLQDININPVQPSLSETNLNIVARGGPVGAGLNEYNPLFERNQVQVNTTGLVGNNDTLGAEGVASAIYNNVSVSAGAFTYNTDGWRDNGSIDQDIQNVFAQWAITPELNVQAEVRHRDTNNGDLEQRFDRSDLDDTLSREIDQTTGRIGLRYSPLPNSDFLLSYIYNEREEGFDQTQSGIFPGIPGVVGPLPFTSPIENDLDDDSHQVEGQYIYRQNRFNLVAGGAFAKVDRHLEVSTQVFGLEPLEPIFPGVSDPVSESQDSDITHPRGYVYGNLNLPEPVTWTVGLSYDDYKEDDFHEQKVNPKFGVRWNIFDNLQFRAAWFRTLKPALANNQTLEPTQIAGFNQFFDDVNATKSTLYGFGLDHQLTPNLSFGAEATWRELDEPLFFGNDAIKDDRDEQTHRAYVYWTPWSELALSVEFVYDRFKAQAGGATSDLPNIPEKVTTVSVPAHARYFWKNGLFAGAGVTFVYQDVDRFDTATANEGDDRFVVVDATAGYRLPKRFGVFSLGVQNVFDRNFNFQDDSYREFRDEPSTGPYIPDFQIVARLTVNLDFFGWPPFSGRD